MQFHFNTPTNNKRFEIIIGEQPPSGKYTAKFYCDTRNEIDTFLDLFRKSGNTESIAAYKLSEGYRHPVFYRKALTPKTETIVNT